VKAIRRVGRDAIAHALRGCASVTSRVRHSVPRALGAFALASAILLLSFTAAQAQTATTTTVTSSQNPSVAGQPVTFSAVVSGSGGTPTGTVTFLDGGSPIGSGTLGSNGQTSFTIATLAVGNHTITASYPGDGTFAGSTGSLTGNPQVVNKK
jgi:Bacterial Ig-like domain (group 3)